MIDWLYRVTLHTGVALLALSLLAIVFARLSPSIRCWLWRAGYLKCLATMAVAVTISVPLLPAKPLHKAEELSLPVTSSIASDFVQVASSAPPLVAPQDLSVETPPIVTNAPAISFPELLLMLYFAGMGIVLLRWVYSVARAMLLWRSANQVSVPETEGIANRLGLRSTPRIARHPAVSTPLYTFGGVLLPEAASAKEPLILAHELAHVRRKDLAWEVLGGLIQIALWFHPLVWWVRQQERLAREQAADALALSVSGVSPADYARMLFINATSIGTTVVAVGAFERPSLLRQRIGALSKPALAPARARVYAGLLVLASLVVLLPWRAVARQTPKQLPRPVRKPVPNVIHFGKVIRLDRSPIAGALVTLQRQGRIADYSLWPNQIVWENLASTRTAADGSFHFSSTFPANARIQVRAAGFATTERYDFDKTHGWRATMQPPIRWEAIVIDEKGRPFAGKRIQTNNGKLGTTDAEGRYIVTDGEETNRPWGLFRTDEPGWVLKSLDIRRRDGLIVQRLMAQRGGVIEGELVNHKGEPVSFASIHILASEQRNPIAVKLDRRGQFISELLPPGDYRVTITPSRHRLAEKLAPKDFPRVTLTAQKAHLRVTLTPGTTVQGMVTDSKTGKPLPEVYVWATRPVSIIHRGQRELRGESFHGLAALTDKQGRYSLQLPPGEEITLTVKSRKHPRISQRDTSIATAKISDTKEGKVWVQNFALRLEEPVTGQVVNEQGEPVAGVTLSIPGGYRERKVGVTNQNGQFSIAEGYFFFQNNFTLLAKKGEARGQWQASNLKSYQPIRLVLKAKQTVIVRGSISAGIHGAFVKISTEQSGVKRMARVSVKTDGQFAVSIDSNMPLYAEIGAPGFGTIRRKLSAAAPGSTIHLGHISLPRANGGVSGQLSLRDEKGRPIKHADLTISGEHAGVTARLTDRGAFAATGLVPSDKLVAGVGIPVGRKWKVWSIPLPAQRRHGLKLQVSGPPTAVFGG